MTAPKRPRPVPLPEAHWPDAATAAAARLFQPLSLGPRTARTRTWVPAMVPWRATDDGFVTPNNLDWYGRFARGRPGVLVAEATGIRDVKSGPLLRIGHDRFVPGLRDLVQRVKDESDGETLFFVQLIDFLVVRRRPEPATWFARWYRPQPGHAAALADITGRAEDAALDDDALRTALQEAGPEAWRAVLDERAFEELERGYRERVTDTHLPHIRDLPQVLPELFASAARRAVEAGFDGVELHYAHAYTMASFLSRTNVRTDGYGGSPEGRLRLPLEVLAAVRAAVGDAAVVGARILGDEVIAGGSRIDDACRYAIALAEGGLDVLSLSKGGRFEDAKVPRIGEAVYPYTGPSGHECMPTVRIDERGPFARNLPLAAAVRNAVHQAGHAMPIVAAGGFCTFDMMEDALVAGHADAIASARQSLADPDWFEKIRQGRGDEIRRCVFTNYCEGLDQMHREVTCKLWDKDIAPDDTTTPRAADGRRRLVAPDWPRS
ncbi:MAG: NADH:flavin oxidoreductase [Planctomycetes bacterium]|nr:NADH:flavin oxidoreductase [Planctomycetota bacterium]MCB9829509.1 NADH:flavin oxidoreductase [Planctomycetota bacterium]